jgi:hypothetical protein
MWRDVYSGVLSRGRRYGFVGAVAVALSVASCGDDGTGPSDGNIGEEKIVLSARTSDGWTCHFYIDETSTPYNCAGYYRQYESERIEDFWIPGGFRVLTHSTRGPAYDCCSYQKKEGKIMSGKINLSGYKTLRLKTHLKFDADSYTNPGGYCDVYVTIHSNVPNTPDLLGVINEYFSARQGPVYTIEKDIDVSLENAIGYKEATIEIRVKLMGGCGGLNNDHSIELGDFRIVGTR